VNAKYKVGCDLRGSPPLISLSVAIIERALEDIELCINKRNPKYPSWAWSTSHFEEFFNIIPHLLLSLGLTNVNVDAVADRLRSKISTLRKTRGK
jgi:hypothetical protein